MQVSELERKQAEAAQAVARLSSEAEQAKLALLQALQAAGNMPFMDNRGLFAKTSRTFTENVSLWDKSLKN